MKKIFIITAFTLFTAMLFAAPEKRITRPLDIMGTGGAGVAALGKTGMMFMNPASFASEQYASFSILEIGAGFNPDLINLQSVFEHYNAAGGDVTALNQDDWSKILSANPKLGISGPFKVGWVGKGLALMLYNDISVDFSIVQTPGLPLIDTSLIADVGIMAGYAFKFAMPFDLFFKDVYLGFDARIIERAKYVNPRLSFVEAADVVSSIASGERGFDLGTGFAFDAGVILKQENLSLGATFRDLFSFFLWDEYLLQNGSITPTGNQVSNTGFAAAMDIGLSYALPEFLPGLLLKDLTVYFDLADVFNMTENYLLKVRLGADVRLLTIIRLGAGLYKGYPTAYIGLDLPLVKVNAAYFAEELGLYPGNRTQHNLYANIQLMI